MQHYCLFSDISGLFLSILEVKVALGSQGRLSGLFIRITLKSK
jgi:hypothetical protein